jgi:hypothetical protein
MSPTLHVRYLRTFSAVAAGKIVVINVKIENGRRRYRSGKIIDIARWFVVAGIIAINIHLSQAISEKRWGSDGEGGKSWVAARDFVGKRRFLKICIWKLIYQFDAIKMMLFCM